MCTRLCVSAHPHCPPQTGKKETTCSGFHYIRWANQGWQANEFVKTIDLNHGLTMTTSIDDPANILLPMYPKLYEGLPALYISSNSASKSMSWTSEFNQMITGCHFSLYDMTQLNLDGVEIKGYKGLTEIQPILSKTTAIATKTQLTNTPFSANRKINVLFAQSIDKFVITYRKNKNSLYPRGSMLLISDVALFCPPPAVAPELLKSVCLSKIAPTGNVNQGDIISYLFQFNNLEKTPQIVCISDVLPNNFSWLPESFVGNLSGITNNYGGNRIFSIEKLVLPHGLSAFTIDAYVGAEVGKYAHQALFRINNKLQLSDDPNQKGWTGLSNQTPITVVAPKLIAPLKIIKKVSVPTALNTDVITFTYTFQNTGVKTIVADFRDEIQADTAHYKTSSLVFEGGIMGMENLYGQSSALYINDLHIPIGSSTIKVQVALNGCSTGFYKSAATITPVATAGFRSIEMPSDEALWAVVSNNDAELVVDCKGTKVENNFTANELQNQLGYIQLKVNVLKSGKNHFKINGAGITGDLTTTLGAETTFLKIPIQYDGSGRDGLRPITITSELGSKVCIVNTLIESPVKTEVARVKRRSK
jgi:hypothetical protein